MRTFKLLIDETNSELTLRTLRFFDRNIQVINKMGVKLEVVFIPEEDFDQEMVGELNSRGISRLPAIVTDAQKIHLGFDKIKELFESNIKVYRQRMTGEAPRTPKMSTDEFGTNADLSEFWKQGMLDDESQEDTEGGFEKELNKKMKKYQPPKHRQQTGGDDSMGEPGLGMRQRNTSRQKAPPRSRGTDRRPAPEPTTDDPEDNIEIEPVGTNVMETLDRTEHEEHNSADADMERAMWNKTGSDVNLD